jgi:hypothetical protein
VLAVVRKPEPFSGDGNLANPGGVDIKISVIIPRLHHSWKYYTAGYAAGQIGNPLNTRFNSKR